MKYHIAKKQSKATVSVSHNCRNCDKDFHSFYLSWEHKPKEHGAERSSGAQNDVVEHVLGNVDDNSLKEELGTCKDILVDNEIVTGKHRVYNFAMDTLDPKNQLEKLDVVFDSLKYATELNVEFGFVLKNVEVGSCRH